MTITTDSNSNIKTNMDLESGFAIQEIVEEEMPTVQNQSTSRSSSRKLLLAIAGMVLVVLGTSDAVSRLGSVNGNVAQGVGGQKTNEDVVHSGRKLECTDDWTCGGDDDWWLGGKY